jgi:hypothetical protein
MKYYSKALEAEEDIEDEEEGPEDEEEESDDENKFLPKILTEYGRCYSYNSQLAIPQ